MKIKIVNIALLLLSFFGTLTVLSVFPDEIPVHFNFYGVADRWGSKYEMMIMPVVMVFMLGIWFICDKKYRKEADASGDEKKNAEAKANLKVMDITFTLCSILFLVLNAVFLYMSYSQLDSTQVVAFDSMRITTVLTGIFFVVMGNFLPKAKKNSMVGFRFPWTQYNDVTWTKCNRFAGYVMVICGLLTAIGGLILGEIGASVLLMVTVFGSLIVMLIYAYLVYNDEKKKSGK